ncbi:MAG: hypothetical protein JGK17_24855 [Microcoleus sp. PH2017_10_PVI_O_A]|uniref:hypothetical protein n=1 Tax=unclassified Microcoleus TaxID=2642155 RepID=UPI001D5CD612|nr:MULTISPECIES: hypothetical protein [unclassified Microcoleus]MCC3408745.1 hypothetical protein [Microcoleus sp. PH2017_10_PVI_O_A]MCC3462833.1 hypothetical protein [Microcoleus sp. PH2017_11_PCY_U_A]MCC3481316.1 hypothetical protein [Microcoleus sp. PH2017_12_PCY_D_A]MCC3531352.1 hypothetical protein [Microcoleus sp. PH2017_21_RUC_O_A]MCC3543670.1 hypothetical protein [Microcoleus sp. PH2017_22_RUC_O_B]
MADRPFREGLFTTITNFQCDRQFYGRRVLESDRAGVWYLVARAARAIENCSSF